MANPCPRGKSGSRSWARRSVGHRGWHRCSCDDRPFAHFSCAHPLSRTRTLTIGRAGFASALGFLGTGPPLPAPACLHHQRSRKLAARTTADQSYSRRLRASGYRAYVAAALACATERLSAWIARGSTRAKVNERQIALVGAGSRESTHTPRLPYETAPRGRTRRPRRDALSPRVRSLLAHAGARSRVGLRRSPRGRGAGTSPSRVLPARPIGQPEGQERGRPPSPRRGGRSNPHAPRAEDELTTRQDRSVMSVVTFLLFGRECPPDREVTRIFNHSVRISQLVEPRRTL